MHTSLLYIYILLFCIWTKKKKGSSEIPPALQMIKRHDVGVGTVVHAETACPVPSMALRHSLPIVLL